MKLHEVVSAEEIQFTTRDKLSMVMEILSLRSQSCALICDEGKPVGILSENDLMRLFSQHIKTPVSGDLTLADVMTRNFITVPANIELSDAISLVREHNLRHLPVVDTYGLLLGVVHLADLVTAYLGVINRQNEFEELNKELHWLSLEDSLTGLPNRRSMEIELKHSEAVAKRRCEPFAVALLDIDHFKIYNEHRGAQTADLLLKQLAQIIKSKIRGSDRVFRYGGKEFIYLMPGTNTAGATLAADRLRKAIYDTGILFPQSSHGVVTVSVGVAAKNSGMWQELLKQAENAVYQAKMQGRNAVSATQNSD